MFDLGFLQSSPPAASSAAAVAGDARYDRLSVVTDIIYSRITTDTATPRGILADEVDLKQETFAALIGAGYTVLEDPRGRLDVIGGVKIWYTETTVSLSGGPLGGASAKDNATWVDAMAGVRGVYSITPTVYLTAWGLIGAGGADLDWDVMAGIGYKWNDAISAMAGYRALGVNYSDDTLTNDIVEHGSDPGCGFPFLRLRKALVATRRPPCHCSKAKIFLQSFFMSTTSQFRRPASSRALSSFPKAESRS